MKKYILTLGAMALCALSQAALLYDNGPMITHAGQGPGGVDVSMCGADPNTAGSTCKLIDATIDYFHVADDFTMTQSFNLDDVVMYCYESQQAGNPSWTSVTMNLWSGEPGAGGTIIATKSCTWADTNIYRMFNGVLNNTTRRVRQITAQFAGMTLPAGTYWVDLQTATAGTLNTFANYVMDPNAANPNDPILRLGNCHQKTSTGVWGLALITKLDGVTTVTPELPFLVHGSLGTTTETLAPTSEALSLGKGTGGDLSSWAADDGNIRTICKFFIPNVNSPFIRANLGYVTTKTNPTAISFNVRVAVDAGGTQQITLNVQDKTNSAFVNTSVVGQNTAANTTYNGAASGTLSNYVGGGGAMTGQIEVKAIGFQTSAFPCIGFDSALMVVTG